jgi:UDP-N-acetylmuramate dehydrogenase
MANGFLITENVPLASHTTLRVGGGASFFCVVTNIDELRHAVAFARVRELAWCVIGGGSNVQVSDDGYNGLVIKMAILGRSLFNAVHQSITYDVAAGEIWDDIVADTVNRGWWGIENLSAIPGSVGAVPIQNVGAYGVEVSEKIAFVTVYDTVTETVAVIDGQDCRFGYRDSYFKNQGKHLIVISVAFTLSLVPTPILTYKDIKNFFLLSTPTIQEIRDAVIAIRSKKFPDWHTTGTAGSFFKNPIIARTHAVALLEKYPALPIYAVSDELVKVSLGYILDAVCGLRGMRRGALSLYEHQALVLVAHTGATSREVDEFVACVTNLVFEKTQIVIEREVVRL